MTPKRVSRVAAGLITVVTFAALLALARLAPRESEAGDKPAAGKPVGLPANLGGVHIQLGLKDTAATDWDGEVTVSTGRVLSIDILQGNVKASAKGGKFSVRSVFAMKKDKKKDDIVRPILRVTLD